MKMVCECGQPAVMWGVCGETLRYFLIASLALNVVQALLRIFF